MNEKETILEPVDSSGYAIHDNVELGGGIYHTYEIVSAITVITIFIAILIIFIVKKIKNK